MRPSDRTIRDELRREAARVTIPGDMWGNIKQRLDGELVVADRRKRLANGRAQWKPAAVFAAAAGIFWLTVIPISSYMDGASVSDPLTPPMARTVVQPDLTRIRQLPGDGERQVTATSAPSNSVSQVDHRLINVPLNHNVPTRY